MLLAAALIAICPPPPATRHHCVHDGDTIWWEGEKIRIAAIDTPELDSEDPAERRRAITARDRLVQLLNANEVRVERIGQDCYGRTLAHIRPVGRQLVREGLADRWTGPLIPRCR